MFGKNLVVTWVVGIPSVVLPAFRNRKIWKTMKSRCRGSVASWKAPQANYATRSTPRATARRAEC